MPKPTKLHSTGKAKATSLQKPCNSCNLDKDPSSLENEQEFVVRQFELELCWCIQQLERTLQQKKGSEKQIQDTWKVLHVLKNNNQPIIRKRQLMRSHFGDYRAKMLAEEKKLTKMASKMKISDKPDQPKATFLRKSVFLTTGDSSFRFNFDLAPEQVDNGKTNVRCLETQDGNPNNVTGNISANVSNTVLSAGDANIQTQPVIEDNSSKFKFAMSGAGFRFNFNVDSS